MCFTFRQWRVKWKINWTNVVSQRCPTCLVMMIYICVKLTRIPGMSAKTWPPYHWNRLAGMLPLSAVFTCRVTTSPRCPRNCSPCWPTCWIWTCPRTTLSSCLTKSATVASWSVSPSNRTDSELCPRVSVSVKGCTVWTSAGTRSPRCRHAWPSWDASADWLPRTCSWCGCRKTSATWRTSPSCSWVGTASPASHTASPGSPSWPRCGWMGWRGAPSRQTLSCPRNTLRRFSRPTTWWPGWKSMIR